MKPAQLFNNAPCRADLMKLSEPFPADDIEWRMGRCGKTKAGKFWGMCLAYITNRAIMERLDLVCGPDNWRNEFAAGPTGGLLCGLSIRVAHPTDDGVTFEWVTKWDGAENTDIEGVKGGLSGAMKRAGSQWGIGRYLYNLEETFVQIVEKGKDARERRAQTPEKDGRETFYWIPPRLPSWAVPAPSENAA
jgi:hypothetical protein